ncbi:PhzF family phenazine biosynthesis protein [Saccharococcus caldoxylosilyticus]|uniref:Putative henazine biosynthesis protein n=1 Tax=Parageobacillus caldoxylosilyticus NBRC 107762 TaxID=1220594 RepID=A0A023DGT1_9BACL|nr:PhzF family phenazine biosynthesis protein [Parageobacillus caldoxylosilyticus]MBB3853657.1 PhzF family phenazine biosynthesis protein [Parageobacillus caldoxylosilyticus]GAJ40452.1 putative henazine biosynthesis protein [Parageobacillus caldoxylosilyticus NBRC 107762]
MLSVVQTKVFDISSDGGNPCPLVLNSDSLTNKQMQSIASYYGVETAFILQPESRNALFRLRYFVPKHEMEMCVHATVGAVSYWCQSHEIKQLNGTVETALGEIAVNAQEKDGRLNVIVEQFPPTFSNENPSPSEVAQALKISEEELDLSVGPIQSVSTSRPKLMIPLRSHEILHNLDPDFGLLWELCDRYQTTGFYPFTLTTQSSKYDVEARQFPKRAGYNEDPATGVAACALGAYLTYYSKLQEPKEGWYEYLIGQGYAMGKPSMIKAASYISKEGSITKTRVGGYATILQTENIDINLII